MAYDVKTLKEITERVEGNIISAFSLQSPVLRNSFVSIVARVIASAFWLLQGFVDWGWKQSFVQYADEENLNDLGYEIGIDRKPASFARGTVQFNGVEGFLIPAQTVISRLSDQYTYMTEVDGVISGGIADIKVVSQLVLNTDPILPPIQNIGDIANTPVNTECETTNSVTGINTDCFFSIAATGGFDEETIEDYQTRILFKKQNSPGGGNDAQYVEWATSITGVTDAFVTANFPSVSDVTIAVGNYVDPNEPEIEQSIIDEVSVYCNDRTRRPVTAEAYVLSVQKSNIDIVVKITPLTESIVNASDDQLRNLFRDEGIPTSTYNTVSEITKNKITSELVSLPGVNNVEIISLKQDQIEVEKIQLNYFKTAVLRSSSYSELI